MAMASIPTETYTLQVVESMYPVLNQVPMVPSTITAKQQSQAEP